MPITATTGAPTSIRPDELYTLPGFITASGISYTRIRSAAAAGVDLNSFGFAVGRRKFIKGIAAIEYLEKLAAHSAAKEGGEA